MICWPAALTDPQPGPRVSVVVPTLNEKDNLLVLFDRLAAALGDLPWEMIVVDDDSDDGTAAVAKIRAASDRRLRCLRRVGRRGLAEAAIEGMLASSAAIVVVMDGDLQHDEAILGRMLELVRRGEADIVIGSRHQGRSPGGLSRPRQWLSQGGKALSRLVLARDVTDPMSGFFAMRRDLFEDIAPRLVTDGFKVLADILFNIPAETRVSEVAYRFRARLSGKSKLDVRVLLDYGGLLLHRLSGGLISARMTTYGAVGALGLVAHLVILRALLLGLPQADFGHLEILACYGAMALNFALNNILTFRERRVTGWAMVPTFALFSGVCSVGVIADIGVADWVFAGPSTWWMASLLGAMTSTFWNYAVSAAVVWSPRPGRARLSASVSRSSGRPSRQKLGSGVGKRSDRAAPPQGTFELCRRRRRGVERGPHGAEELSGGVSGR